MISVLLDVDESHEYQEKRTTFTKSLDARPMVGDRIEVELKHSVNYYKVRNITFNKDGKIVASVELIMKYYKK